MFVLAALAAALALRRLPTRLLAFPIVVLAAALKVYPATLLVLALRERPALCLATAALSVAALLGYAAIDAAGLREMLAVVPGGTPFLYWFGAQQHPGRPGHRVRLVAGGAGRRAGGAAVRHGGLCRGAPRGAAPRGGHAHPGGGDRSAESGPCSSSAASSWARAANIARCTCCSCCRRSPRWPRRPARHAVSPRAPSGSSCCSSGAMSPAPRWTSSPAASRPVRPRRLAAAGRRRPAAVAGARTRLVVDVALLLALLLAMLPDLPCIAALRGRPQGAPSADRSSGDQPAGDLPSGDRSLRGRQ